MANSKLLKEAIADAKAVKETALANAKLALEEAFTPRLQSILSQKLREEAEEGDDDMQNEELDSSNIGTADSSGKTPGKVPTLDADTELAQGMKKSTAKKGLEDPNRTIVNDLMEGDEDEMGGDDKEAEIAELRARLAELEGEQPEIEDEGAWNEGDDMGDDESGDDGEDYEITGDEEEDTDDDSDEDDMDLESIIRELEAQLGEGEDEESKEDDTQMESYSDGSDAGTDKGVDPKVVTNEGEDDKEDVIDLEEILREMEADMKKDDEEMNEDDTHDPAKPDESGALRAELKEAYTTIKSLQSTINEVNLLNAKLLFANKLFRAHNMTNEQKVKVIETLDRTKSVREVKLVYATLAENLKPVTASNKVAKKSISEGFASKVVKSTKPAAPAQKQVIAESADFADRFRKLAGIIK